MKKPYNVDKWSERDLGWKPVAHAENLPEALRKIADLKAKNPGIDFRAREKGTSNIPYSTRAK